MSDDIKPGDVAQVMGHMEGVEVGTPVLVVGVEPMVFDPDDPENSTELMYLCLLGGKIEHVFKADLEHIKK